MKIIDYILVTEQLVGDYSSNRHVPLGERVKSWIDRGYQPFGSPFVHRGLASQAVVKYENYAP